jgi:VWFA-related protein
MVIRVSLTACLVAATVAMPFARPQQSPVFRSGVDLVTVDATVIDGDGRPIEGLGPADFSIKVDGQSRPIVSVQFVSRVTSAEADRPVDTVPAARASSNESVSDARLVLVAVDQSNIRRLEGRLALRAAERFLDSLNPSDRAAVVAVNYAGDIEFTKDRAAAKRKLATMTGEAVPALIQPEYNLGLAEALLIADGNKARLEVAVRRECGTSLGRINATNSPERAADTMPARDPCPTQLEQEARMTAQQVRTEASLSLNALMDLIARLKTIDGPKTVALLSEGLIAEPQLVDLTLLGAAAQEARVTIYVLQLEQPLMDITTEQMSPTLLEDIQLRESGLARLAGSSRGALFRLAGSDQAPFERILRELSGYYLLAFEATDTDRNGKPHRIDVSLNRGGATLRAREAFRYESVSWARRLTEGRLVDLLRSSAVASEMPLRAASYSFFEPASGKVRVEISAETEPSDEITSAVLFGFVLVDSRGVIAASQVQETLTRRFTATAQVDPGVYTLKVAALDRFGRTGSVPRAVLAGISDSPIPTSELMVARVPVTPDSALDPIVDRTNEPRILAHVELYPEAGQSMRDVDVTFVVRPAMRSASVLTRTAAISTRSERHAVARAMLPIQDLEPGRYILRADVTNAGTTVGYVERAFTVDR